MLPLEETLPPPSGRRYWVGGAVRELRAKFTRARHTDFHLHLVLAARKRESLQFLPGTFFLADRNWICPFVANPS